VYAVAFVLILSIATAGVLTSLATVGAATTAAVYHNFSEQLPVVTGLSQRDVFQTTRILDRDGNLLYELFDQDEGKRTIVRLGDMSPLLIQAVLAVEDASFYDNPGVDPRGVARAIVQNVRAGEVVSGASTITQQLIKNVLLDPAERNDESFNRKVKEAILAVELSRNFSKDQILEWYLNEINYGNLSYGIGTASRTYFNKETRDLTLGVAALLAGLPQSPARYDPYQNFGAAKRRQEDVLDLMAHHHFISAEEAEAAKQAPIELVSIDTSSPQIRYPHWVFYVRSVLEEMYGAKGLYSAGLTVYTTIDPHLQDMAQDAVQRHLDVLRAQDATNAALVAIEPWTGEILAMVGSPDYNNTAIAGQVNAAVVERQPGSSIKPIVYLSAFLKGYTPGTVVQDTPLSLPDGSGRIWRPQNFDNRFRGPVTLRQALGNSLNIPAVKVLQYAGLNDTVALAKRLGMTSLRDPSAYGLAFTLGGGEVRLVELATAYSVLANSGIQVPVSPIMKILDSDGRVVYEHKMTRQQVIDPRVVFMVNDTLSDNGARTATFGANSVLRLANEQSTGCCQDGIDGRLSRLLDDWLYAESGHGRLGRSG
jgi:membrane peptidoglycan carboxypeptidase